MAEKEEISDSAETVEYEDDFEKDLDWLINEEGQSHTVDSEEYDEDDDIEAKIDKELEDGGKEENLSTEQQPQSETSPELNEDLSIKEPSPVIDQPEPLSDEDGEATFLETKLVTPEEGEDNEDEEAKKYIMEKIEQANRQLEDEEPVNESRERKLKFKDNLIDMEVPPLEYVEYDNDNDGEVSGKMSELQISNDEELEISPVSAGGAKDEESRDKKVLVERDGKFELLSLQDIESQAFLPRVSGASSENEPKHNSPRSSYFNSLGPRGDGPSFSQDINGFSPTGSELNYLPRPPSAPKGRPSSATSIGRNARKKTSTRRVQSANLPPKWSAYCLTPEQKQLQKKIEQRREQQRKEEEAQKREEEERKRQENEFAFKAWLQKKKEQLQEEKRVQRAKKIEELNSCKDSPTELQLEGLKHMEQQDVRDPEEAFKMWLKKKREEHLRERLMEQLKKQEEESSYLIREREECERAFKQWLRRKRAEKRMEQFAAKERTRRLMIEARKARRTQDLLYSISEANSFRFIDYRGYRF